MNTGRLLAVLTCLLLTTSGAGAQPVNLAVANHSFELPAVADSAFNTGATYPQQGGYGWLFSFSGTTSGMYNPPANTYATAGGNGTPVGAHGSQLGWSTGGTIFQTLAGPDLTQGTADDPLLASATTYSLTVSIGTRLPGNQYGIDSFGGYDIRLIAGSTIIAQEINAFTPAVGTFADRVLSVNSQTLNSALIGQPLSIYLAATGGGVTDFDNVRLVAVTSVPEPVAWMWISSAVLLPTGLLLHSVQRSKQRRRVGVPVCR